MRDGVLMITICLLTLLCGITTMAVVDTNTRVRELEKKLEAQAFEQMKQGHLHDDLAHYVHTSRLLLGSPDALALDEPTPLEDPK